MKKGNFSLKRSSSGLGLYPNIFFKKDDFIIEYTGDLLLNKLADGKNSRYLFAVNSRWTIDGSDRKNLSCYLNHSCRPNREAWIKGQKVLIYARKRIKPGDELNYNYGKEYFDEYIKPSGCKCSHCLGKNR